MAAYNFHRIFNAGKHTRRIHEREEKGASRYLGKWGKRKRKITRGEITRGHSRFVLE